MRELLARFADAPDCRCDPMFDDDTLAVDVADCPGGGDLASEPACRATVVDALRERDADAVVTRHGGLARRYHGRAAALLVAAGRFAERVAFHDGSMAARATRDPLAAGVQAAGRAGPVADAAVETGLAAVAGAAADYDDALRAYEGPTVARSFVAPTPPPDARLAETRSLDGGATVRIYARPDAELRTYHLEPVEATLDDDAFRTLARAQDVLARGGVSGGARAPRRAVRRVATDDNPVDALADVLAKHARGFGVLEDLFADPAVTDAFASAPVDENPVRVRADGETLRTNVRLTADGAAALASRVRRASGRAFSRASPTLDAVVPLGDGRARVAGVTDPVSDGIGFAFRAHDGDPFTLPALVAAGTLPAPAAALLSLAAERSVAALVAGTRGAGKTTLLGALLWELPAVTRLVAIEDTPELPVGALQVHGRDVQALRTTADPGERGVSPARALRAALRLGEGALVVGEVRGEEARVLYEAMRVGAGGSTVLGTIHGDGGADVRERVVSDLGVPASSFAATDLVVTLAPERTPDGVRRRVTRVEEVTEDGFAALFESGPDGLTATGRIDRGNSRLVAALAGPEDEYRDVRDDLAARRRFVRRLVSRDDTAPADVVAAHARRRAT